MVDAQYRYWRRSPPAHKLIAAQLGYKPPGPETESITPQDRAVMQQVEERVTRKLPQTLLAAFEAARSPP